MVHLTRGELISLLEANIYNEKKLVPKKKAQLIQNRKESEMGYRLKGKKYVVK